jgi:hypothetical protein
VGGWRALGHIEFLQLREFTLINLEIHSFRIFSGSILWRNTFADDSLFFVLPAYVFSRRVVD